MSQERSVSGSTAEPGASVSPLKVTLTQGAQGSFRVPVSKKILFFQNLGMMLGAGVGIVSALDTLSNQNPEELVTVGARRRTMSKKLRADQVAELFDKRTSKEKRRLEATRSRDDAERLSAQLAILVLEGHSLSHSMSQFPDVFSEREVHLAEVGEQSGSLHKVLLALAQDELKSYQRFLNFRKELYAPLFTLTGALAFFLTIPGMLFESLIETNMMTSGLGFQLVKASSFLTSPPFLAAFGVFLVLLTLVMRDAGRRQRVGRRVVRWLRILPPVDKIFRLRRALAFTQSFQTLNQSGVSLIRGLELALDSCADEEFKRVKKDILEDIKAGKTIAQALSRDDIEIVPSAVLSFIAVGEDSGNIPELLESSIFLMEQDLESAVHGLTALINPLILSFVAAVILVLGVSVFQAVSSFSAL